MPEAPVRTEERVTASQTVTLPPIDIRRKRPPALSFLLRLDTLRRVSRVVSLLALDFAGLFVAMLTALMVKAVVRDGNWAWDGLVARDEGEHRLRLPRHRAALRALEPLRGARAAAGPAADRLLAVPGDGRRADLRARQGRAVLELLHLLRHADLRDRLRLELPLGVREGHGLAAARRGLPAPRRDRRLGQAHRGGPPRARRRGARAGGHARLHLAHAAAGQRAALARGDRGAAGGARAPPGPGGHHRRPGLPGGARGRARRPVPPPRRDRADRAVDDGDPRAPRGVRPRRVGAAVRAAPAGVRRLRLRAQADLRLRRRDPAAARAQPAADRDLAGRLPHVARPGAVPLDPAGHRRRAVRVLQVPHDAHGRGPGPGRPRVAQRGLRPAVQDQGRPAAHARRPAAAPVLARRAAAAAQRRRRADVARRPAAAAAARLRPARGVAQEALPRAARA